MKIIFGQDGETFDIALEKKFDFLDGDIRYIKREHKKVFDFVGFVVANKETLVVFPKHYFSSEELIRLNKNPSIGLHDAELLFKVLSAYMQEDSLHTATADKYFGDDKDYDSDYPFSAFFTIYDYYRKYGLYYEEKNVLTTGQNGKVSWKDTIRRSNVIVSNGNVLFSPLVSKIKNRQNNFISECMIFAINHTLKTFPFFLSMKSVSGIMPKFDFIANRAYVLKRLRKIQGAVFKDVHKRLVSSLITFFEEFEQKKHGGNVYVKISFFDRVWERMINKYLNHYFVEVNSETGEIIFDESQTCSEVKFKEEIFHIDNSPNSFKIKPDHYGQEPGKQYIFDSKYYYEILDFNYKQFAYDVLLQAFNNTYETYNVLILPGLEGCSYHLDLKPEFQNKSMRNHRIIEQYICPKTVMRHYVKES